MVIHLLHSKIPSPACLPGHTTPWDDPLRLWGPEVANAATAEREVMAKGIQQRIADGPGVCLKGVLVLGGVSGYAPEMGRRILSFSNLYFFPL